MIVTAFLSHVEHAMFLKIMTQKLEKLKKEQKKYHLNRPLIKHIWRLHRYESRRFSNLWRKNPPRRRAMAPFRNAFVSTSRFGRKLFFFAFLICILLLFLFA
jgi:hypothetical protein